MRAYVCLAALLLPLSAQAEDKISTVSVMGEAETKMTPDQAIVPVTIGSDNKDQNTVKKDSDEKLQKLLQIASTYGVAKEDMQTEYNSVQPKYDYGQGVTTQIDVYTGNINFTIDATSLAADKVDSFTEALEKAGLTNIGSSNHNDTVHITANFNDHNPDTQALHTILRNKENEVLAIIDKFGIDKSKVSRNSYVNKGKESHSEAPKQRISGYHSMVSVNFTLKDKEKVTPFINAVVKEGVDNIGNVTFNLSRDAEKKVKEEIMLKALKNANEKAQALATASGMTLGNPISINENAANIQPPPFYPRPMFRGAMAMNAEAAPVAAQAEMPAGQTTIQQNINITYQIK
jgi:uncharacterized protein YggE